METIPKASRSTKYSITQYKSEFQNLNKDMKHVTLDIPTATKNSKEMKVRNEKHVSFSVRHSYYVENNFNLKCIINYFIHNSNVHNPIKSTLLTNNTKVTSMIIKQTELESNDLSYTLSYLLLLIIFPLILCSIPMAKSEYGTIKNHLFYSLCIIPLLSTLLSLFGVIWMEVFFECKFKYRFIMVLAWMPLSALLHFSISLIIRKLIPCGLDMILIMIVIGTGIMTYIMLPNDQRQEGYVSQIISATITLLSGVLCIHLIMLMEFTRNRSILIIILVTIILPILFTRFNTDIQESLPYVPQDFSLLSSIFFSWSFSFCMYIVLIYLSKSIQFIILYIILSLTDLLCIFFVGPIWNLWAKVGTLKASGYDYTIFYWAKEPLKPKPIYVKYFTKLMSALVFMIIFGYCHICYNKASFKFNEEEILKDGMIWQIYLAMVMEMVTAITWLFWIYKVMKDRCNHESFIDIICQFSKLFQHCCISGCVVICVAFLLKAYPSYTSILEP